MDYPKGTSRIVNLPPIEDIENDDDLLFTNTFVSSINFKDTSFSEKENFRKYYENNNQINVDKKTNKDTKKIERISVIDIDSSKRDKNFYPEQSNFKIPLGKTFYNVKKIKLISTCIPNTDQAIKDRPLEIKNNTIYWQNFEDRDLGILHNVVIETTEPGTVDLYIQDHNIQDKTEIKIFNSTGSPTVNGRWVVNVIDKDTLRFYFFNGISFSATASVDLGYPKYSVNITPGNYSIKTLATEMQRQMNSIKRRTGLLDIYHYFTIDVDLNTDIMTFRSFVLRLLEKNPISTFIGTGIIAVNEISHGLKKGDYALMVGVKSVAGIPSSYLNGLFQVDVINSDSFVYEINKKASVSTEGGGSNCEVGRYSPFRLLFEITKLAYNIGFPDEDSGVFINKESSTPISTLVRNVDSASLLGDYVEFTSLNHGFTPANVNTITSISTGQDPTVFVSTPHLLQGSKRVYIYYPHCSPVLNNFYKITISGEDTFIINGINIISSFPGTGFLKSEGDVVMLNNFKCIPNTKGRKFYIENVSTDTFQVHIPEGIKSIQDSSDILAVTNQLYINHPNHRFCKISSIDPSGTTRALITTSVKHNLTGVKYNNVQIYTVINDTADLIIISHGLETSDTIYISNSDTVPVVKGEFFVEIIDSDTLRIFFPDGITTSGFCEVNVGDTVVLSCTDSIPDVSVDYLENSIYYIEYVSDTEFLIDTGYQITTPGTRGIIGRNQNFSLHRVLPSDPGGDNFAGIPLTDINHAYHKIYKIIDEDNYVTCVNSFAEFAFSGGGNKITLSSESHGFDVFQNNTDTNEEKGKLYRNISLDGENYIFLVSPNLKTIYNPGTENLGDIFAKILLSEPPGYMVFDSYISTSKDFNPPISVFKNIELTVKRNDGYLFDFHDRDYSISLEITEIVDQLNNSGISDRTGASDIY